MYCRNCGEKIPEDSTGDYCNFCGARVDGARPGGRKGGKSRWKTVVIIILTVLLLCALTVIGVFAFMFGKMSKMQEGGPSGFSAENGGESARQPEKRPEDRPEEREEKPQQETPTAPMPSAPEQDDSESYGFDDSMPSFGYGENGMPSGGPGGQGGQMGSGGDEWMGDDPAATLSSICKDGGIPSDAEAITDSLELDGLWKAIEYGSEASYYRAEASVDGNDMTLTLSDPGLRTDEGDGGAAHAGDYSGTVTEKDGRCSVKLSNTSDKSSGIELRNIYSKDGNVFAAGVFAGGSSSEEVYFVLWKPDRY